MKTFEAQSLQLTLTAYCLDRPVLNLWNYFRRPRVLYPAAGLPYWNGIRTRWNTRPWPDRTDPGFFFASRTRDLSSTFMGYMLGIFQSDRVNMLRMSEVNAADHQSMQHMLTEGRADWGGFGCQVAQEADALLGGDDAVLLFDESAFAKKGKASAGVARQWNGRLGKVDNCQVCVFAALCRDDLATLIDTRLYLPQSWAEDAARCERAAIPPEARAYQSKSQLALTMLKTARQRGIRFGYTGFDGGYGKEPAFLRNVNQLDCRFVADVHCH